jgi:hypothetical protein
MRYAQKIINPEKRAPSTLLSTTNGGLARGKYRN